MNAFQAMRIVWSAAIAVGCLSPFAASAQEVELEIAHAAPGHQITWNTRLNHNYQVYATDDLQTWFDTGILEPGILKPGTEDSTITYGFDPIEPALFYRVRETEDLDLGGFLVLPYQDQVIDLSDGVRIAFNLDVLPDLPEKIRIYTRPYNEVGADWEQIGLITEFAVTSNGVPFVRGSVVWIPSPGAAEDQEVRAAAVDASGGVFAIATRQIRILQNELFVITITGFTAGPSSPNFTTVFEQELEQDPVRRVDYFDDQIYLGTDYAAPFGDNIINRDRRYYPLRRGRHTISAIAYDSSRVVGMTQSDYVVDVTASSARPTLTITTPTQVECTQGESFQIGYAADDDGDADLNGFVTLIEAYDYTNPQGFVFLADDTSVPTGSLTISTDQDWEPGNYVIEVIATDNSYDWSYPVYIELKILDPVSGTTFADDLAAVIADENSVAIANDTFLGVPESSGIFTDGLDAGLEMDEGVLLTTGRFDSWNLGNQSERTQTLWGEPGYVPLEDRIAGSYTKDAAVLSFDAECVYSQIEIEVQFGSEEYLEFVAQGEVCHNDAMMISVDNVIVSLVPDGSDIIAVNTAHPFIAHDDSECSEGDVPAVNEHLYEPTPPPAPSGVEYNGMVIRLRLHVLAESGETRRIVCAIADVDDDELDSGLFLQMASFRTRNVTP
jgi:hypothetical protein